MVPKADRTNEPVNAWFDEWILQRKILLDSIDRAEVMAEGPTDAVNWRYVADQLNRSVSTLASAASRAAQMAAWQERQRQ